jgi:hypothetical protein
VSKNSDIALQTVNRILSEAAFIFTDNIEKDAVPDLKTWEADGVSLTFSGKPSGELCMWVSPGFACFAAANMLGDDADSEESRAKGLDALKELLNMIVGNFITSAYGDTPVFELGIPQNRDRSFLLEDAAEADSFWLEADGNPVLFVIKTKT